MLPGHLLSDLYECRLEVLSSIGKIVRFNFVCFPLPFTTKYNKEVVYADATSLSS